MAPEYYQDEDTGEIRWDDLGEGAYSTTTAVIDNTAPEIKAVSLDVMNNSLPDYGDDFKCSVEGVYAATNADGFIFAVDAIGDLYVIYEKDVQQSERIRNLGYVLEGMAYDPLNDWIYGVTTDSELIRFDRLGLTVENLGAIGVTTNNLACDDQGNLGYLDV